MTLQLAAVLLSSALVGTPAPVTEAPECDGGPLAVVAGVLQLTPEQAQALGTLLHARQQALEPILREIAVREQRIRELVASGGNPAEIGLLMLQVHQLRQAAEAAQAHFLTAF
ncbi:MAG TPA: hypothetical protein VFO85_17550, partial [Vicinamibacteria bacterium]|nr:hypothetical protein [Vicinamibacteria bacterium]